MKVIIAGSRSIRDYFRVVEAVKQSNFEITEVVSGGAKGVDSLGELYAETNDIDCCIYIAQWKNLDAPGARIKEGPYGKYNVLAGLNRNVEMAEYADALIAVHDGKSTGTQHMIKVAVERGLKVSIYAVP